MFLSNNLFTHNFIRIIFTIQGYSMTTTTNPPINEEKLEQFMGKVLSDFGGAASAVLTYIPLYLV